jgi:c-di-GMP-binding flagellar brake protein YcgR
LNLPQTMDVLDVIGSSHSGGLWGSVEEVHGDELVVAVPRERAQRPVRFAADEAMEIVWKGPDGLVGIPVELSAIERGTDQRLRLRITGPAFPTQRRAAVRAPMEVPVTLRNGRRQLTGTTIDLSEGGLRALVDAPVLPDADPTSPTAAAATPPHTEQLKMSDGLDLVIMLTDGAVECRGIVVRSTMLGDGRQDVSVFYHGLKAATQDLIRRQVFAVLRELRSQGLL